MQAMPCRAISVLCCAVLCRDWCVVCSTGLEDGGMGDGMEGLSSKHDIHHKKPAQKQPLNLPSQPPPHSALAASTARGQLCCVVLSYALLHIACHACHAPQIWRMTIWMMVMEGLSSNAGGSRRQEEMQGLQV